MEIGENNILDYLDDDNKLRGLSHSTIDSWISEAPYSYLFHLLKAKKYVVEGQDIPEETLHKAACYSNDRKWMKEQLFPTDIEDGEMGVGSPKSEVRSGEMEVGSPKSEVRSGESETTIEGLNEKKKEEMEVGSGESEVGSQKLEVGSQEMEVGSGKSEVRSGESETTIEGLKKVKKKSRVKKESKSSLKKGEKDLITFEDNISSFTSWLRSMNEIEDEGENEPKRKKKKEKKKTKKKKKRSRLEKMLQKSLHLKQGIVSETYADLLLEQGHTERAKEMYKALIMKYPEKSNTFASKLEKIEKK